MHVAGLDLVDEILELKRERNAVILAHNYQANEIQELADFVGDSLGLSFNAAPRDRNLLFVPDQNLGSWVTEQTGRKMDLWKGNCYVHIEFTQNAINRIKAEFPEAKVVAHPECTFAVRMLADEVCSTEKMINYCRNSAADAFIIVTESGMLHRLKKEIPGKTFIAGPTETCACADCRFMKKNTLEKLRDSL